MVTLSQKEMQRMRVIEKAVDGRLSVREAAGLLRRSERQVQRLKRRYRPDSVDWVRHGNRGKPRTWALDRSLRQRVLALATAKYAGFNDSHLRQKLVENEGLTLSPGERAPHFAQGQTTFSPEAPSASVSCPPSTPGPLRPDASHRCQPP